MKNRIFVSFVFMLVNSWFLIACESKDSGINLNEIAIEEDTGEFLDANDAMILPEISVQNANIAVYVCGAVNSPGVYYFNKETRVVDAIIAARGMRADADVNYINQAQPVEDGAKIYVPTCDEVASARGEASIETVISTDINSYSGSTQDNSLININTAGEDELMTIPGIGKTKAKQIIDYRNQNGTFKRIEDIMQIQGIKEGTFNKIKDKICI